MKRENLFGIYLINATVFCVLIEMYNFTNNFPLGIGLIYYWLPLIAFSLFQLPRNKK